MRFSYVYILTNKNHTVLYTGVTSNLLKRVYQHKTKAYKGFTARYNCDQLFYYQEFSNISRAIDFEKKIKAEYRMAKENCFSRLAAPSQRRSKVVMVFARKERTK